MSRRVWRYLPVVTVLVTVSLVLATAKNRQFCDRNHLNQAIQQLSDPQKRIDAQEVLLQCDRAAVQPLAIALSEHSPRTRLYAAKLLGLIGWEARSAVADLVILSQEDSNLDVRRSAILALSAIGRGSRDHAIGLKGWQIGEVRDLQNLQQQLSIVLAELKKDEQDWTRKAEDLETLRLAHNAVQTPLRALTNKPSYQITSWLVSWAKSNLLIIGIVCSLGLVGVIYLVILRLRPLLLLKIEDTWIEAEAIKLPYVGAIISPILRFLLVPLKYNSWVLGAWVEAHISTVRSNFLERGSVSSRAIHISQPVLLKDQHKEFIPENLFDLFQKSPLRLVIWGEGGAGKTSLAYQLALWAMWGSTQEDEPELRKKLYLHRMIPIIIEEPLKEEESLRDSIRKKLEALTHEISDELLIKLLQRQRLLVIVDHLSEMTATEVEKIVRELKALTAISALIVTSRSQDILWKDAAPTYMQPLPVNSANLESFLRNYLKQQIQQQQLEEKFLNEVTKDIDKARKNLARMVNLQDAADRKENQGTKILLVTLYAKQMIAAAKKNSEASAKSGVSLSLGLPDSVPDLMLDYLKALHSNSSPSLEIKLEQQQLNRIAQFVAWQCLEETYKPGPALQTSVVEALEGFLKTVKEELQLNGSVSPEQYLKYLGSASAQGSGLSLIQKRDADETLIFNLDPLAEYLASLHLVRDYGTDEKKWLDFLNEVKQKSGVEIKQAKGFFLALYDCCRPRYGLKTPLPPENVLQELGKLAELDEAVVQEFEQRRRMDLATEDLEERNVRYQLRAIEDLATVAKEDATPDKSLRQLAVEKLQAVLENADFYEAKVLREAGKTLQTLKEPVPLLVAEIRSGVETLLLLPQPEARIVGLSDDVTLELVKIPEGDFWMGSEEGERLGREQPRHRVEVKAFWMGRYPVTQAQWQVVAGWEKVKVDLDPQPARFKGSDRPVEKVSWYDAVEFCNRLSHRFSDQKMTFRLPSEAEWEYACRAVTQTPYHFGKTITEELANINFASRKIWNSTIPVGQDGVANRFGLYDMHGNVWEWCEDGWHENYKGAPDNGVAWTTENKEAQRLLRGGSWNSPPAHCRSAYRNSECPKTKNFNIGFRVVCVLA